MNNNQLLKEFVDNMKSPNIKFVDSPIFNYSINLKTLCKDLENFSNIESWLNNKKAPQHLRNNLIKALLSINPPENVRNELITLFL